MARATWVHDISEGSANQKDRLGGKGAGLAEMTRIGLPVPPGFTITTDACRSFMAEKRLPDGAWAQVLTALKRLEAARGQRFGDATNPLLVSVRSGAPVSMPGMMDTVLNLGLNPSTVEGLATLTQSSAFAWDAYRRFLTMFGDIVLGVPKADLEQVADSYRKRAGVAREIDLSSAELAAMVQELRELITRRSGRPFPDEPLEQLALAVTAVFQSWNNPRAETYRRHNGIPDTLGTAVNVQAMVFGNMGEDSASGVAFTRDPSTGERKLVGEFLPNSQGEDVVAGTRTPRPIQELAFTAPRAFQELRQVCQTLEQHYRDVQDIEFTVQNGTLFMLQTRNAQRTAAAAVRIAVEMAREKLITKDEAVLRVQPRQLDQLLHPQIGVPPGTAALCRGLNASPGAAAGQVVFSADEAEEEAKAGHPVVLVRTETNPDDVHGFFAAQGILTSRGGMSSHAAVVARGMGKPCVSGCEAIRVNEAEGSFSAGGAVVRRGDWITIDGTTGNIFLGNLPTREGKLTPQFQELLSWADDRARMKVRANADTPANARRAREFGAVGIGLCRTERMFNDPDRLPIVRRMILAESAAERTAALAELETLQRADFLEIFRAMDGYPVTVRTIDPPLHEFLPMKDELIERVTRAHATGRQDPGVAEDERFLAKIRQIEEQNPMLGLRGCRLSILHPDIPRMQARAIVDACCELARNGVSVAPEIMVPLVGHVEELRELRRHIEEEVHRVLRVQGTRVDVQIGTMIELPRACLTADEIAQSADFFSFGTNDLTQTTFGYSRDDAEHAFLFDYLDRGVLTENPFEILDRAGVGRLVKLAVELGRKTKPKLKIGICGEHGGEPSSIDFFHEAGLSYVSCSPFRVPVARLAAAQATLRENAKAVVYSTV